VREEVESGNDRRKAKEEAPEECPEAQQQQPPRPSSDPVGMPREAQEAKQEEVGEEVPEEAILSGQVPTREDFLAERLTASEVGSVGSFPTNKRRPSGPALSSCVTAKLRPPSGLGKQQEPEDTDRRAIDEDGCTPRSTNVSSIYSSVGERMSLGLTGRSSLGSSLAGSFRNKRYGNKAADMWREDPWRDPGLEDPFLPASSLPLVPSEPGTYSDRSPIPKDDESTRSWDQEKLKRRNIEEEDAITCPPSSQRTSMRTPVTSRGPSFRTSWASTSQAGSHQGFAHHRRYSSGSYMDEEAKDAIMHSASHLVLDDEVTSSTGGERISLGPSNQLQPSPRNSGFRRSRRHRVIDLWREEMWEEEEGSLVPPVLPQLPPASERVSEVASVNDQTEEDKPRVSSVFLWQEECQASHPCERISLTSSRASEATSEQPSFTRTFRRSQGLRTSADGVLRGEVELWREQMTQITSRSEGFRSETGAASCVSIPSPPSSQRPSKRFTEPRTLFTGSRPNAFSADL
jgi:hypothetical protein